MDFCFLLFRIEDWLVHGSALLFQCLELLRFGRKHWQAPNHLLSLASRWEPIIMGRAPPLQCHPPPGNGPLIRPYFFWDRGFRGGWYQTTSNFIKTFLYNNPKRTKSAQKFEIPDGRHIFWPKEWENSKMKIIGIPCILSKQMEPSTTKVPIHTKMR